MAAPSGWAASAPTTWATSHSVSSSRKLEQRGVGREIVGIGLLAQPELLVGAVIVIGVVVVTAAIDCKLLIC